MMLFAIAMMLFIASYLFVKDPMPAHRFLTSNWLIQTNELPSLIFQ